MSSLPWCIIGDYNDLLSQQDKFGIHPHLNWFCNGFREAVKVVLVDVNGYTYIGHR